MNTDQLHFFRDELEKSADLVFAPRGSKSAPVTAAGVFVNRKGGLKDFQALLKSEGGSLQKAKASYQKAHPDDFVTLAFKRESAPTRGGFLGIGGDKHFKAKRKNYEERLSKPRVFMREGREGAYAQHAMYKEVARGLYDDELNLPWLSKKDRAVYT